MNDEKPMLVQGSFNDLIKISVARNPAPKPKPIKTTKRRLKIKGVKMRVFLPIILLFFIKSAYTQIPIKKLISFADNKYSIVTDYLIGNGWKFKGVDTTNGIHSTWANVHNDSMKIANHLLYCFFKTVPKLNKDSIYSIAYINLTKKEYLQFFKKLPSLGFEKTKSKDYQGDLSVEYEKKINIDNKKAFIFAKLLQFTTAGATTKRTTYQFTVSYLN